MYSKSVVSLFGPRHLDILVLMDEPPQRAGSFHVRIYQLFLDGGPTRRTALPGWARLACDASSNASAT